ncbi:MAG: TA0956 family protein [Candidatus Thermoplasmatota archaeon]|nr:TA0956 family protein [Candidatus Thermoplasmatota archaeon]
MTDCAMFNITIGGIHPSIVCIDIKKIGESCDSLIETLNSGYPEEGLKEFIESFARTDEIMPKDKTLGFVVVNSDRKYISLSFANLSNEHFDLISKKAEAFRKAGFTVEEDLQ